MQDKEKYINPLLPAKNSSIPLTVIDRSRRQKISKDIIDMKSSTNPLDPIDIYRILYPTAAEYTFTI